MMLLQEVQEKTSTMKQALSYMPGMTVSEYEIFLEGYCRGTRDAQNRALGIVRDQPVDRIGQNPFMEEENV